VDDRASVRFSAAAVHPPRFGLNAALQPLVSIETGSYAYHLKLKAKEAKETFQSTT
jgi:hypothetical protein